MAEQSLANSETAGAICQDLPHVCHQIAQDFPDAEIQVASVHCAGEGIQHSTPEALQEILQSLSRKFSEVAVKYHPKNTYGFVAELWDGGEAGHARKNGRPRIFILVLKVGGTPFTVGSTAAPRQVFKLDEEF